MIYAIDLGGSTIDYVLFDEQKNKIKKIKSLESQQFPQKNIIDIISKFDIENEVIIEKKIYITGGKSHFFPNSIIIKNIEVIVKKITEFQALTHGAQYLSDIKKGLAISLGTGTAMVFFDGKNFEHVKGTGIGGGSFIGLGKALLGIESFDELAKLAEQGEKKNIDVSIKEMVGGDLGMLSGNATASNFAKYSKKSNRSDVALGISTLIAESIAMLAVEKSLRLGVKTIVVGGKFSKLSILQKHMKRSAKMFDLRCIFPKKSEYMTVIGAGVSSVFTHDEEK